MKPAPYEPDALPAIKLERSATGHVSSPWWNYENHEKEVRRGKMQYLCGGRFHGIASMAKASFASLLGLTEDEVIVTQKPVNQAGEVWWRITTINPLSPSAYRRLTTKPLPSPRSHTPRLADYPVDLPPCSS